MLLTGTALAQGDLQLREQEIKAGLLYNFLKYTDWPQSSAQAPMTVCILGNDPFSGFLNPMAGRTVNQREIMLRHLKDISEADVCQLLFINADEKHRWPQLKKLLAGRPILTVSDFPGFAMEGGMIEFGRKDNRIQALMSLSAATSSGLHIQERLLRLVTLVRGGAP